MKVVYDDEFITAWYYEDKKLFKIRWKAETKNITEEEVRKKVSRITNYILELESLYILSDDRFRENLYTVEVQQWIADKLVHSCIKAGVKKFAVLNPINFVAELSTEQVADEAISKNIPIDVKLFKEEEEALDWFLQ